MDKKFVSVILGTNRKGRQSEKIARYIIKILEEKENIEAKLIDVATAKPKEGDYGLEYEGYNDLIKKTDHLILVVPEYNHSFPGTLKSLMDMAFEEYKGKPVNVVGVSAGRFGGTRVIQSLIPVLREYGLMISQRDLNISEVTDIDVEKDEKFKERIDKFLEEIL